MMMIIQNSHSNSSTIRSPTTPTPIQSPLSTSHRHSLDHVIASPITAGEHPLMLARVRLSDISPFDGAPARNYLRGVEELSGSLMRHNAAVIELGCEDAAIMKCGLEATRLFFRSRVQSGACKGGGRSVYMYRAGRALEDWDASPPCMAEMYRCMGKAARAALSAIARHLRLRSDVFNHLLDDTPLPCNEVSSSVLLASYSNTSLQNGKGPLGGGRATFNSEVEKGLLTLISSDNPGLQVCDPNGRWYLADCGSAPADLLLITGKSLSHATAGLRPAASYRAAPDHASGTNNGGRISLAFRLIPQGNAILDCSPIAAAGHVIPQSYVPISVSQFMDDLSAEEDVICSQPDNNNNNNNNYAAQYNLTKEPSLRSVLSDPISLDSNEILQSLCDNGRGAFLDDAVFFSCGHSFGGLMLKRVREMSRCTLCNAQIEPGSSVPNFALRAAAAAVKQEDDRRLFHNAAQRKRRKEMGDQTDHVKRSSRENGDVAGDDRAVQYPFSVNEKVVIKGNKRTPEKIVGKEATITQQCLNGWYLLKIIGSGENVRLQYRSLRKISVSQANEERCGSLQIQNHNS